MNDLNICISQVIANNENVEPHVGKSGVESPYVSLCKFSCNLCKYKSHRWHLMRVHMTQKHKTRGKRNAQEFASHVEHFTCKECKKQILHDPGIISNHIRVRFGRNYFDFMEQLM